MALPASDPVREPEPPPEAPPPPAPRRRLSADRLRTIAITLVLISGLIILGRYGHRQYPIGKWLFWRYAGYWLACVVWALGCASAGHVIVKKVLPARLPFREHLGVSFATGVFSFYLLMSVAGLFYLFRAPLFFALPLSMLAVGGPGLYRATRRYLRGAAFVRRRATQRPLWEYAVFAFGLAGLAMVYFAILTPENVQFDSRWKHFALAEEYVVTRGVRRFAEGWTVETNPHLATYVYTWGFLLPFGQLFDRVELAAHLEFTVFVATTLTIPVLVRRLVPGTPARFAWAARFLFPGVFLYDSSLSGGADHIAALFTTPLFLLLLRARRELEPRHCALSAVMLAGGAMTKLTGLLMLVPVPAAAIGIRAIMVAIRGGRPGEPPRRRAWLGPLAALGAGIVVTSTFWLKNWIWYGDPLYPSLHKLLHLRPWTVDAADLFEWGYKDFQFWRPSRDLKGVWQTAKALFAFSFEPNDYSNFHGAAPVFGSLFTLLVLCLPLLRKTRRLWALTAATYLAITVWYWTHHQDRYLQTLLPWMTAVTVGTMVLLWRVGLPARIGLGALVALQIVWGGDVYFNQTHAMVRSPLKASIDLLSAGFRKEYDARLRVSLSGWPDVGKALPRGARVLLHDNHVHLGIAAETVNDWGGWQFGISYGRLAGPRQVYDLLKGMGVTHVAWEGGYSKGWDSLAGDIVFFDFALRHTVERRAVGGVSLARMPAQPPPDRALDMVAFLGCDNHYRSGLYPLRDLTVPVFGPRSSKYPKPRVEKTAKTTAESIAAQAKILVLDERCQKPISGFELAARRRIVRNGNGTKELTIWFRTGSGAPKTPVPATAPVPVPGSPDDPGAAKKP